MVFDNFHNKIISCLIDKEMVNREGLKTTTSLKIREVSSS